jgi:D-alanyl-D-alanine carboxypeptidase (penicillin-binding protein 5/6)
MTDSSFTSPSGLDDHGYSTARDLAVVTRAAFADPLFGRIVRTKFHDVPAPSGPPRHIQNRNILLWLYPPAIGVKTGFTTPAGHCLIAAGDRDGVRLLVVALGSPGSNAAGVFNDGAALLNYGYGAFQEEPLIHAGDPVGPFTVEGVPVPAVSAATLVQLVRRDLLETVAIQVRMAAGLFLPVRAGSRIGSVVITVNGERAGTVDVVATATVSATPPTPPPEPQPPSGIDPFGRLVRLVHDLIQALVGPFL